MIKKKIKELLLKKPSKAFFYDWAKKKDDEPIEEKLAEISSKKNFKIKIPFITIKF